MSSSLKTLKSMICDELDSIAAKGELTPGSLGTIDQLTHSLKSIETILAMEDSGYSGAGYPDWSYNGRYGGGRYTRHYSGDSSEERMIEKLRSMLETTDSPKVGKALKECISQING